MDLKNTKVIAVVITSNSKAFAHLSDTQLLIGRVVDDVCSYEPYIVLTSGPPTYRFSGGNTKDKMLEIARKNLTKLLYCANYVIIDHHILRDIEGSKWLDNIRNEFSERVMCIADYYGLPRLLLEAWRRLIYSVLPLNNNWFLDMSYLGYGEAVMICRDIVNALIKELPRGITPSEDEIVKYLKEFREVFQNNYRSWIVNYSNSS